MARNCSATGLGNDKLLKDQIDSLKSRQNLLAKQQEAVSKEQKIIADQLETQARYEQILRMRAQQSVEQHLDTDAAAGLSSAVIIDMVDDAISVKHDSYVVDGGLNEPESQEVDPRTQDSDNTGPWPSSPTNEQEQQAKSHTQMFHCSPDLELQLANSEHFANVVPTADLKGLIELHCYFCRANSTLRNGNVELLRGIRGLISHISQLHSRFFDGFICTRSWTYQNCVRHQLDQEQIGAVRRNDVDGYFVEKRLGLWARIVETQRMLLSQVTTGPLEVDDQVANWLEPLWAAHSARTQQLEREPPALAHGTQAVAAQTHQNSSKALHDCAICAIEMGVCSRDQPACHRCCVRGSSCSYDAASASANVEHERAPTRKRSIALPDSNPADVGFQSHKRLRAPPVEHGQTEGRR